MYILLRFQYVYFFSTKTIKQNYQTLYFQLAHNKFSFVLYFKLNHHTLLLCILCLKINTINITINSNLRTLGAWPNIVRICTIQLDLADVNLKI